MFLYYFNPLKFVKACCMAQDIHYLSKCSVGTWKKKMFCYCWVECPYMSSKFYLLIALSRSLIFLLIFCLVALSVAEKTVLKSLSIIVDFSISFFRIVLYQVWDIEISSMQLAVFPFSTWKIFCYFSSAERKNCQLHTWYLYISHLIQNYPEKRNRKIHNYR